MSYAVVDLGSNSFHLLIVKTDCKSDLIRLNVKTHMAQGLNKTGLLCTDAIARGLSCLVDFRTYLDNYGVTNLVACATAAFREASNTDEFLKQGKQILGTPIKVISGDEEARLMYIGGHRHISFKQHNCVIDIGGGSSEVVYGMHDKLIQVASLPIGVVGTGERFFLSPVFSYKSFIAARTELAQELKSSLEPFAAISNKVTTALGTSGAISCLEEVGKYFVQSLDHNILTHEYINKIAQEWDGKPLDSVLLSDLPSKLNYLVPAGMAILDLLLEELNIKVYICRTSLCDGMLTLL